MTQLRRTAAVLLATGLSLGLAGCGGSEPAATAPSKKTTSATPSESPTPSPSATPTKRPLSRFEGKPAVKAARSWAAGVGKAINNDNKSMGGAAPYSTGDAARFYPIFRDEFGLHYPGPLPFTPVGVRVSGATATVPSCVWGGGWGLKPSTNLPVEGRKIYPVDLIFKKAGSSWKLDVFQGRSGSCSDVPVKGVAW